MIQNKTESACPQSPNPPLPNPGNVPDNYYTYLLHKY